MPFFVHDHINFHFKEKGRGIPFLFQHGLGGDAAAVQDLMGNLPEVRLISLDSRAHGETTPVGDSDKIRFHVFADDCIALMDHMGISTAIIGGSSMGAGVALNLTLRYPERVTGLVLQRPAWLDAPRPENVEVFSLIATLLKQHGPKAGSEIFKQHPAYLSIASISSDSASSLLAQFSHPRALEAIARLEKIPNDAPNWNRREWKNIKVPTLVLANQLDPIHPFEYGKVLAAEITGAAFKELTPKSIDLRMYTSEIRSFVGEFLGTMLNKQSRTAAQ